MKNLYILLLILVTSSVAQSQSRSINRFINNHKVQDNALAISVPGWMLDLVGFGANFIDDQDEEVRELLRLSDNISKIRLLVIEEGADIKSKNVKKLIKGLRNENFEELITVRSPDADVKLLVKEKRNKIRNITAFVQSEDTLVLVTLSGRFSYDDLKNLEFWDEMNEEAEDALEEIL